MQALDDATSDLSHLGEHKMDKGLLEQSDIKVVGEGRDVFVEVDGVRIARRGYPNSPQAGTWVSLEPGWEVFDGEDFESITVKHTEAQVH